MQLELGANEQRRHLSVSRSAGAAAVDVARQKMNLLAVLVSNDGAFSGSRVSAEDHAVLLIRQGCYYCAIMTDSIRRHPP